MKRAEFERLFTRLQQIPRWAGTPSNCVLRNPQFSPRDNVVYVTNQGKTVMDAFSLEGKLLGIWGQESLEDLHAMYTKKVTLFRKPLSYVTPSGTSIGEESLRDYIQRSFLQMEQAIDKGYVLFIAHQTFCTGYESVALPARKMCVINAKKETKV